MTGMNASASASASYLEKSLLHDTFYSHLYLDEHTGSLYFNVHNNELYMYAKVVAKLVDYYYNERRIHSKLIKVDALIRPLNRTESIYINLIFRKKPNNFKPSSTLSLTPPPPPILMQQRQFLLNTNNLLDLFERGDEFVVEINIEENSPTWLSLGDDYDVTVNEGQLINVRKYFESKLNRRKSLSQQSLLDKLKYYNDDDDYFYIEDNVNGILLTKSSIQFDYEVERSYFTRVMIVQESEEDEEDESFVYWLDVRINVVNIVDEPFVCSQPVYYVSVDENEIKNKELFKLNIIDYDMSMNDVTSKVKIFEAQIVTGNAQGLFDMSGLSLYTSNSARKLDRETRAQHELEIRVIEKSNDNLDVVETTAAVVSSKSVNGHEAATASRRYATCKIVVNVNDVNDNR
jgi:hypothetical protein